jgi:GntR family transcriptional regulator
MDIIINPALQQPLYLQIVEQFKELVSRNILSEGEQLPSIRSLATELDVSIITTKRAYQELEQQGFITTIPSRGSFVSRQSHDQIIEQYLEKIQSHMRSIQLLSQFVGLSDQELALMYELVKDGRE